MTPKTQGKDFNFFTRISIVNTDFPSNADVIFPLNGNPSFSLINEGVDTIEYSFNGLTMHGDLVPATPSAALFFNNRGINSIWFRAPSGNSTSIRIEAMATGTLGAGGGSSGGGGGGGPITIAGPLGSKTKSQSVAVTLATNEPNLGVNQGTAASVSSAWPTKISDGTDTVGISDVSGEKALKVDVIQSVGGGGGGGSDVFGSPVPAQGSSVGFSDGTDLQLARVYDTDSGAGSQYTLGVNLRLSGSGGSVEFGTNSNPIRTDPTGSTTQPVSGTVTSNIGTTNGLALDASITALSAKFNSLGQKTMANSAPVVVASDQTAIPASQSGTWTVQPGNTANTTPWLTTINQGGNSATVTGSNALKVDGSAVTQPVSGTLAISNLFALDATLAKLTIAQGAALGSNTQALMGGSVTTAAPSYSTGQISPLSLTTGGLLRVDNSGVTQPVSGTVTSNIGTTNGLALDTTLSTLSGKFTSAASLADATSNPSVTSLGVYNLVFNGTTWDRARSGLSGVQTSLTGIPNVLSMGRYNSSAPTLSDGNVVNLQLDVNGNLKTLEQYAAVAEDNSNGVFAVAIKPIAGSTYAPSLFKDLGSNATANVKNSAGNVLSVLCQNLNAAIRYLQLHNTATTPSASAVPVISIPVPASSTTVIGTDFFNSSGINFSNGIAFAFSTTSGTYTAGTAADQMTQITYK